MRKQFFIVVFGGQGCGKTTLLIQFIKAYILSCSWKRVLVCVPDFAEEKFDRLKSIKVEQLCTSIFKGIKKILVKKIDKQKNSFFAKLKEFFLPNDEDEGKPAPPKFNGLLVLDDARGIFNRRDESFLDFASRRRQANCDIICVFHGLRNEVPPSFYAYVTKLVIFETADSPDETMKLLPPNKQQEFLEIYNRVQGIASGKIPPPKGYEGTNKDGEPMRKFYKEELILREI